MNPRTIEKLPTLLLVATLLIGAAGCGSSDASDATAAVSDASSEQPVSGEVVVTDAWIRQPADGQTLAAGYGTVTNGTDETITLIGASAPITATFEIHETSVGDDGTMSMAEKDGGFEIRARETLTLEPGGAHVMMREIDSTEIAGTIDLTFVFDSTQVTVAAEVREIGDAMDEMDAMDAMDEMES